MRLRPYAALAAALLAVLPSAAMAKAMPEPEPPPPPPPDAESFPELELFGTTGVWGDGEDLVVVVGEDIRLFRRGAAEPTLVVPLAASARAVSGLGVGDGAIVGVVGASGSASRRKGGSWAHASAPDALDIPFVAVVVRADGSLWCAGESRGMFVWSDTGWAEHPYPAGVRGIRRMVAGADSDLYAVGDGGHILLFRDGAWTDLTEPARPWLKGADVYGAWYSPTSRRVWITTVWGDLIAFNDTAVVSKRHTLPAWASVLGAISVGGRDALLAVTSDDRIILVDEDKTYPVETRLTFPHGVWVDTLEETLYVAHTDGLRRVPLEEAFVREAKTGERARLRKPDKKSTTDTGGDKPGSGKRRDAYRRGIRLALGPMWGFPRDESPTALRLDLTLFFRFHAAPKSRAKSARSGIAVGSEIGYAFEGRWPFSHLFQIGWGIGLSRRDFASVLYIPRFVVGTSGRDAAYGFRHGIAFELLLGAVSVELQHQLLRTRGAVGHNLQLAIGVDIGLLVKFFEYRD